MQRLTIYCKFDRNLAYKKTNVKEKVGSVELTRTGLERVPFKTTHSFKNVPLEKTDELVSFILNQGYEITRIQYGSKNLPIFK